LELDLSRAELKKVANKLAVKDSINYRTLTDGEEAEVEAEIEVNEMKKDSYELSKGFKQFVPGPEGSSDQTSRVADSGMVTYKGSVIDVAKLQENLDKSEKVRSATDLRFIELQKKFTSCKDSNERVEKARDKLQTEVKDLKKKVRGLEDELKKSQDVSNKHFNILTDFYSKVKPIVAPPEKTEDKGTETVALVNGVKEDSVEKVEEVAKPSVEPEDES
jgi:chromosome segregation ATPase